MPKQKASKSKVLRAYVSEFGETILSTDGAVLNCIPCEKVLNADTRFQVVQHLETGKHKKCVERKNSKGQQLFLAGSLEKQGKLSPFSLDLCIEFTAADIAPIVQAGKSKIAFFFIQVLAPQRFDPSRFNITKDVLVYFVPFNHESHSRKSSRSQSLDFNRRNRRCKGSSSGQCDCRDFTY